jgi:tetratricopeptide (TPR) repeat protein
MELAFLYNELGWSYRSEQYHRQAAALLEPVVAQQPLLHNSRGQGIRGQLANSYRSIGDRLIRQGRLHEAEPYVRQAIVLSENEPGWGQAVLADSHHTLGSFLEHDGRVPEALQAIQDAIRIRKAVVAASPETAFFRRGLARDHMAHAMLLTKTGSIKEAEDAYRAASDLWEDVAVAGAFRHHIVRGQLVAFLTLLCKSDHSEVAARIASELKGRSARELLTRGRAHEALRDFTHALADYEQAVELDSKDAEAHNHLAWLLANWPEPALRKIDKAVLSARQAKGLEPDNGEYWNTLGIALFRKGECEEAVTVFGTSIDLRNGGDSFDAFFLAMAHWQLEDKEKARDWYDKAVEWMGKYPWDGYQFEELCRFRAEAEELLGLKEYGERPAFTKIGGP